jgi:polyhydroxybutyrate depolymerase
MARFRRKRNLFLTSLLALLGFLSLSLSALALILYLQIHRTNGTIISSGKKRTYLLYVPKSYRADRPAPLVVSIHGFAEWPAHQMEISRWNRVAEENGIIMFYPCGTGFPLHWFTNGQVDALQDVQFISDLIDRLQKEYNIDPQRIYANGLSNGGGMSFLLASSLSERIAAFGGVAGAYLLPWKDYNPVRLVPAIIFHGTQDPIVPFGGGASRSFEYPFPEINSWVKTLAAKNGCSPDPVELPARGEVSGKRYTDDAQNADVDYYIVENGGHSWPGGGYLPGVIVGHTTQDIDATRVMWDFFQQHPLKAINI